MSDLNIWDIVFYILRRRNHHHKAIKTKPDTMWLTLRTSLKVNLIVYVTLNLQIQDIFKTSLQSRLEKKECCRILKVKTNKKDLHRRE